MGETSAISWCDSTFNPVIGCTRVGPGCDHCYAARDNQRRKWVFLRDDDGEPILGVDGKPIASWGERGSTGSPRKRTKTWGDPLKWQRDHAEFYRLHGHARRVFCASLADVFDNEWEEGWRTDLWALLRATPNLNWMLLTKRIGNARKMLPADWPRAFPHVGLMATMVNQQEWDRDMEKLMATPAAWHGVSVEPMLGPIRIGPWRPDWIITGGESGPDRRAFDPEWAALMQVQCDATGITFHHKQNGGVRGKDDGCLIHGREYKAFPRALAA